MDEDEESNNGERRLKNLVEDAEDDSQGSTGRGHSASDTTAFAIHLDSIEFRPAGSAPDAHDIYWSETQEEEDGPDVRPILRTEDEEEEGGADADDEKEVDESIQLDPWGRSLQGVPTQGSAANAFIVGYEHHNDELDHNMKTRGRNKNKNKNQNGKNNNGNKKKLPQIHDVRPTKGTTIQSKQTFGANVHPSVHTGSDIRGVKFRLTDHSGSKSDWLAVPRAGNVLHEITVDGFDRYPGTRW